MANSTCEKHVDIVPTLITDLTSKDIWNKFYTIRGTGDSFEWYAGWTQLRDSLLIHLSAFQSQILVPGCGSSSLSQKLYDVGFKCITNIDISEVVIRDMLSRHVEERPEMVWLVMDMASMEFKDENFDFVLDKGALDALMEPEIGTELGNQYLSEVERVLKKGGKFVCLTLAQSHVLDLLLPKFRHGWKVTLHVILSKSSDTPNLYSFMVIAEKEKSPLLHLISSKLNIQSYQLVDQVHGRLINALERENGIRTEFLSGSDITYLLEDLKLGPTEDLRDFKPGRRAQLTLGELGISPFSYRAVLLDAKKQPDPFNFRCGVFILPKARASEFFFISEKGQWLVTESSKAERLIMVFLDISHSNAGMHDIQKDLSRLVKPLAPESDDSGTPIITFMGPGSGLKSRKIVHQATSALAGLIVVADVVYEDDSNLPLSSDDLTFRRLTFERTERLVQSEALLLMESEQKNTRSASSSKKQRGRSKNVELSANEDQLKVYHAHLASSYHTGIVAGFMLISSCLESASSGRRMLKTVVVGLGAGLLPMFLRACFSFLCMQAVELDPLVSDLAQRFFGFVEDSRLKVHIGDGIQFVRDVATSKASESATVNQAKNSLCGADSQSSNESSSRFEIKGEGSNKIDILIVDVDSSDTSSGLICPASAFVEESFLSTVKDSLSDQGLFVINLGTRSLSVREMVVSRMKKVFTNLFHLQLNEDVNEVLFALKTDAHADKDCLAEASTRLEKLLKLENEGSKQIIMDAAKKIKCLE